MWKLEHNWNTFDHNFQWYLTDFYLSTWNDWCDKTTKNAIQKLSHVFHTFNSNWTPNRCSGSEFLDGPFTRQSHDACVAHIIKSVLSSQTPFILYITNSGLLLSTILKQGKNKISNHISAKLQLVIPLYETIQFKNNYLTSHVRFLPLCKWHV